MMDVTIRVVLDGVEYTLSPETMEAFITAVGARRIPGVLNEAKRIIDDTIDAWNDRELAERRRLGY